MARRRRNVDFNSPPTRADECDPLLSPFTSSWTLRAGGSNHGLTAVDVQCRAGDVPRPIRKPEAVGEPLQPAGSAAPADRDRLPELLDIGLAHAARNIGVSTAPGETALTVMPSITTRPSIHQGRECSPLFITTIASSGRAAGEGALTGVEHDPGRPALPAGVAAHGGPRERRPPSG